ncbi:MarR family winged helix-turn-helix transcriptional regulator [Gillisia hiemivivida]|uniref:HTH-type transcriptional regulator SarZ n=1 Tax=Gillisia hiemivivida TaxID=291190 RepID=A0A5C6ZS25_9FLAO|nr:MarR family transcriptional regulator [Gillisia hiemivivida]TXD91927.1 MarR family transcriptional regulator [Gillisia hiemivivida]
MEKEDQLKLDNQICFPLYSVSRLITKAYKPFLEKMGITYPQYLVLMVLWEQGNLSVNQIGEKLLLNTNTLSPLIKRMEKIDLLNRTRSTKDERSVRIELTKKGKSLKADASEVPGKLLNTLLSEEVELTDVMLLKDTLDKWINVLKEKSEI